MPKNINDSEALCQVEFQYMYKDVIRCDRRIDSNLTNQ